MKLEFPEGFFWGAATSDHQVEGNTVDDWSEWEHQEADALAVTAEKRIRNQASIVGAMPPEWERFRKEAENPGNYISGEGVNHLQLYEQDFDLLKEINLNAYRFSISWARIEPEPGVFDQKAIDHYRLMIKALRDRGIEPFVTLNHYTLPRWFSANGGWLQKDAIKLFVRYAKRVTSEYKDLVKFWMTLNEPVQYAVMFYVVGGVPPTRHWHLFEFYRALNRMAKAHQEAYYAIKSVDHRFQVSVVDNIALVQRRPGIGLKGHLLAGVYDYLLNHYFINLVHGSFDFVALNHYFRFKFKKGMEHNFEYMSDLGWELYPQGLGIVALDAYQDMKKPVYITEHGLADADDKNRAWFILESLRSLQGAIAEGAAVRGYFHWSLMDNFEWDKGWWPRFGLASVNRETQERTLRQSALVYGKIAAENAVHD